MSRVLAVGIDLGTTNSVVAYVTEAGRTAMVANEIGDYITPSCVYFDDEETVVGRAALKAGIFEPDRVASEAKRWLGSAQSPSVRGQPIPPEVTQGCVLAHLKRLIDKKLDAEYRVVISVPAFFDLGRREAVRQSAAVAGLEVLDMINEPTAGALCYAEQHGHLSADNATAEALNLLVYDLGGGTFDVSVIELKGSTARILATDGDVQLGGSDWDRRLADYFAQKFEAQFRLDPRDDPISQARLIRQAEETKQTLGARTKTVVVIEYQKQKLELPVTQEQFEILTSDFLERTAHTTRETLDASGLSVDEIDKVILAGGATRMPMVTSMLERLLGRVPDDSLNPDESIARGAAIYAAHLLHEAGEETPALHCQIVDVNSHSLGIEGVDPITGRRQHTILIPRNTPLPTSALHKFVTRKPDQQTISVKVLEGESTDPEACVVIGKATMRDVPGGLPRGTHIEVVYHYEANGRLLVTIRIPDPKVQGGMLHELQVELHREGRLRDDRVHHWSTAIANGGFDGFARVVKEVLDVELPKGD